MQRATRPCEHCRVQIDKELLECPKCGGDQLSHTGRAIDMAIRVIAAIGAAVFTVVLVASIAGSTSAEGTVGLLAFLILFLLVGGVALIIYSLIDAIRMPDDASFKAGTQVVWVLVILLTGGLGAIIYMVVGRPPGGATAARIRRPPRLQQLPP